MDFNSIDHFIWTKSFSWKCYLIALLFELNCLDNWNIDTNSKRWLNDCKQHLILHSPHPNELQSQAQIKAPNSIVQSKYYLTLCRQSIWFRWNLTTYPIKKSKLFIFFSCFFSSLSLLNIHFQQRGGHRCPPPLSYHGEGVIFFFRQNDVIICRIFLWLTRSGFLLWLSWGQ